MRRLLATLLVLWALPALGQSTWPAGKVSMSGGTTLQQEYDSGGMRAPIRVAYDALPAWPPSDADITYRVIGDDGTCTRTSGPHTMDCVTNGVDDWMPVGGASGGGHGNGANCVAGSYPDGVDQNGAVEVCTDASAETDSLIATHAAVSSAHHTATVDTNAQTECVGVGIYLDGEGNCSSPAGSGTVLSTGSEADTYVAFWSATADTIDGDPDLAFDGIDLTVGGVVNAAAFVATDNPAGGNYIELPDNTSDVAAPAGSNVRVFTNTGGEVSKRDASDPAGGVALLTSGGALGTPSSGTATNLTGTASGLIAGMALVGDTATGFFSSGEIADARIEDTITVSNYLLLAGGTLTGEIVLDETGLEAQPTDAITDCSSYSATGGGIFYDDSEGMFKKCQENVMTDLDTGAGTVNTADISDVNVTQTEFSELEAIDATTISANQWTALGGIAETLTSTELDLLDGLTTLSGANTGDVTVSGQALNLAGQQLSIDTVPSTGSATLEQSEDALQVKYDSTDFGEGASGIELGANPTMGVTGLTGNLNLGTGTIQGSLDPVITTDGTETVVGYGEMYQANHGTASSDTTYTLPDATAGMNGCFYDYGGGAGTIILDPASGDVIILDGIAETADETVVSPGDDGDFICVYAWVDNFWTTMGRSGTWDGGTD